MELKEITEEEIIVKYDRLAKKLANKLYKLKRDKLDTRFEDFEDLLQYAYVGILDAIRSYDETKGANFTTYAWACVQNRINREAFRTRKVNSYYRLGDFSLDACIEDEDDTTFSYLIGEEDVELANTEFKEIQVKLFNRLSKEDRQMLIQYNIEGLTLRDIAKIQGITYQRVLQKINYVTNQLKVAYMREVKKYA